MKVLLVNGGPHQEGNTHAALMECARQLEKEGIEACVTHSREAFLHGKEIELLNDLDLVHLHGDVIMFVKLNLRHGCVPPVLSLSRVITLQRKNPAAVSLQGVMLSFLL